MRIAARACTRPPRRALPRKGRGCRAGGAGVPVRSASPPREDAAKRFVVELRDAYARCNVPCPSTGDARSRLPAAAPAPRLPLCALIHARVHRDCAVALPPPSSVPSAPFRPAQLASVALGPPALSALPLFVNYAYA